MRDFLAFHVAKLAFEASFEEAQSTSNSHNGSSNSNGNSNGDDDAQAAFLAPSSSAENGGGSVETTLEVVTGKGLHSKGMINIGASSCVRACSTALPFSLPHFRCFFYTNVPIYTMRILVLSSYYLIALCDVKSAIYRFFFS